MDHLNYTFLAYFGGVFLSILALALFSKGFPSISGILFGTSIVVATEFGKFAGEEKSI